MGSHSVSSAGRCLQHHNVGSTPGVQFTEEFVQQSSGNLCLIPPPLTKNDLVSDLSENTVQQRFHVSVSLSIPKAAYQTMPGLPWGHKILIEESLQQMKVKTGFTVKLKWCMVSEFPTVFCSYSSLVTFSISRLRNRMIVCRHVSKTLRLTLLLLRQLGSSSEHLLFSLQPLRRVRPLARLSNCFLRSVSNWHWSPSACVAQYSRCERWQRAT